MKEGHWFGRICTALLMLAITMECPTGIVTREVAATPS